jgi:putative FmdB family regulatory protein
MPIYEYLCDDCGNKFEKLVRSSQAASMSIECPSCGETHVTEQLSRFAAHGSSHGSPHGSPQDAMPSCPSGMCGTPGMCGRN